MIKKRGKTRGSDIRLSLINFIQENYSDADEKVGYLFGLVDDYMAMYDVAQKLRADIKKRGVNYQFIDSKDNEVTKKNESITDLNRTTQTMIRIQIQIGIRPVGYKTGDEDEKGGLL